MKILLVLIAFYALWWLLRRSFGRRVQPPAAQPPTALQTMLACAECGVHLPRDEALPGQGGVFCSEAHRAAFERAHSGR